MNAAFPSPTDRFRDEVLADAPTAAFDARELARKYIRAGFAIVPVPARTKAPILKKWPDLRIKEDEVGRYFQKTSNIGLLLGLNGKVDIDLDCPESIRIGAALLPPTPATFGRPGKPHSHKLYVIDPALPMVQFPDPLDPSVMLLEFRCLKKGKEQAIGLQTILPGSVHPSGELIRWDDCMQQPASIDGQELLWTAHWTAAASALARHWPGRGNRHKAMLALAGLLARNGWSEAEAQHFCFAVASAAKTGSPERTAQVKANVTDTYRAYGAGKLVTGHNALRDILPERVVGKVTEWLGLRHTEPLWGGGQTAQEWPAPLALATSLPPVEPFDLQLLPASFRPLVQDVAERMQVGYDFVAIPLVVALAAAAGRRAVMQPKAVDSTWQVVPNLWGAIVAPPGYMKSPAIAAATRPLQEVERAGVSDFEAAKVTYEREKAEYDVRVNAWKQQATEATKKNGPMPERPGGGPVKPAGKRFITNDVTSEALHQILADNPAGVLNLRDELSGWLAQLDKPGREGDRAFWLEAWNGDGSYTMDRIGRGTIRTEACCVSVLGGIQPGRLRSYLTQALIDGPGNDGLLQRFQLLVWPDLNGEWKYCDRKPNQDALDSARKIFARIVQMDPVNPRRYRFGHDAQILFVEWITELEGKIRGNSRHPALTSHLAKYRSLMPGLAMLFELADSDATGHVSLDHAKMAAMWCDYLEPHAERLYSCITSAEVVAAQDLAAKIKAGKLGRDCFTLRDVYLKQWTGLDAPEAVRSAVEVLIDASWVRLQETPPGPQGGRPRQAYSINPKVFDDSK